MWDAVKELLRGKFIVLNELIYYKDERSKINNLNFHLLEKEEMKIN